jgi:hypothetical protein
VTAISIPFLTVDDFRPHEAADWLVDSAPEPLRIRLDEVKAGIASSSRLRQPFILFFSTPSDILLVEALYRMRPAAGGDTVEIYMAPLPTPPGTRRDYQAIFN